VEAIEATEVCDGADGGGGGDRRDDLPPQLAPVLRRLVHVHVHLRLVIIDDTDDKRARQSSVVLCLVGG